jgi:RNA polymerase-associated protein
MAIVAANRRSQMMLFARPHDPQSQRIRLVLEEKGIANVEVVELKPGETSEDLLDLNPYNTLPTLVDRELVLYEPRIIMEYLDERFPHPPLMPVDPVTRARFRLALYRIESDIYRLVPILEEGGANDLRRARKELRETLMGVVDIFSAKAYFLSDEYSLVDCTIAPVLWRLEQYGVELPKQGAPILRYAKRLHERRLTRRSLSEDESDMGD